MPKWTDLRDGARPDSQAIWTVHIVKNDIYFLLYRFTSINFCHFSVASTQDLLEKSYAEFFTNNFDLVLLNKLTYTLSSGPLYTSMC